MRALRRTKTTTVTREWLRAPSPGGAIAAWCDACSQAAHFVEPETAAVLTGATRRQVYRAVEAGTLHFVETGEDWLWLCVASLDGLRSEAKTQG